MSSFWHVSSYISIQKNKILQMYGVPPNAELSWRYTVMHHPEVGVQCVHIVCY